jgi:hypothetical protein
MFLSVQRIPEFGSPRDLECEGSAASGHLESFEVYSGLSKAPPVKDKDEQETYLLLS